MSNTPSAHATGTWYTSRNIVVSIFCANVRFGARQTARRYSRHACW